VERVYGRYPRDIFGLCFGFSEHRQYSDLLGQGEDLFIVADHYDGRIGPANGLPCFTPGDLSAWLRARVLPWNYCGSISLGLDSTAPGYSELLLRELGGEYAGRIHVALLNEGKVLPTRGVGVRVESGSEQGR